MFKKKDLIKTEDGWITDKLEIITKDDITKLVKERDELQNRINKAIEYTNQFINFKTSRIDEWENVELVLETIVSLLKGDNK